jgi:hypothetical protein
MSVRLLLLFLTVSTGIADVVGARGYCDMVTFILKWMSRSHLGSVLDVLYMHRKIMR